VYELSLTWLSCGWKVIIHESTYLLCDLKKFVICSTLCYSWPLRLVWHLSKSHKRTYSLNLMVYLLVLKLHPMAYKSAGWLRIKIDSSDTDLYKVGYVAMSWRQRRRTTLTNTVKLFTSGHIQKTSSWRPNTADCKNRTENWSKRGTFCRARMQRVSWTAPMRRKNRIRRS